MPSLDDNAHSLARKEWRDRSPARGCVLFVVVVKKKEERKKGTKKDGSGRKNKEGVMVVRVEKNRI